MEFDAKLVSMAAVFNAELVSVVAAGDEYKNGYDAGYSDGRDIWNYARNLQQMFENAKFPQGIHIEINIPNLSSKTANYMFRSATGVEKITLKCDRRGTAMSWHGAFSRCYDLKILDLSEFDTTFATSTDVFYDCTSLEEIRGEINNTTTTWSLWFKSCDALREIRFKENSIKGGELNISYSAQLSDESIQSIIGGLVDLTGSTSAKLMLHAKVKAKLTAEQLATIENKNWMLG